MKKILLGIMSILVLSIPASAFTLDEAINTALGFRGDIVAANLVTIGKSLL